MIARAALIAVGVWLGSPVVVGAADGPILTVRLNTGGQVAGRLLGGDDVVVVLDCDGFPCAFGYDQLLADSAYRTRLAALGWQRGGRDRLIAADHFALGVLALRHDRHAFAKRDFAAATRLDETYRPRAAEALAAYRDRRRAVRGGSTPTRSSSSGTDSEHVSLAFSSDANPGRLDETGAARRARIIAGYKRVGEDVRRRVGSDLRLLETPHFLIWTDWARAEHDALRGWCEAMYTSLAVRFGVASQESIFAGKCPIFCLRSRKRFVDVAALLDHYDVTGALGYTSSDGNGHVHVVVCRQGGSPAARDAFASTLIHEGTHAFLHRYRSSRHLPMWLNEGLANQLASAVLGDRCPNARAAAAVAREVVASHHDIAPVFVDAGELDARFYPVAHSLVDYLIARDAVAFMGLIDDIKDGVPVASSLDARFGLTWARLDRAWRASSR